MLINGVPPAKPCQRANESRQEGRGSEQLPPLLLVAADSAQVQADPADPGFGAATGRERLPESATTVALAGNRSLPVAAPGAFADLGSGRMSRPYIAG